MSNLASVFEGVVRSVNDQNHRAERMPLPVAGQSPITEILVAHMAAAVPETIGRRIRTASSIEAVFDWLSVGALYRTANARGINLAADSSFTLPDEPKQAIEATTVALARHLDLRRVRATWLGRLLYR